MHTSYIIQSYIIHVSYHYHYHYHVFISHVMCKCVNLKTPGSEVKVWFPWYTDVLNKMFWEVPWAFSMHYPVSTLLLVIWLSSSELEPAEWWQVTASVSTSIVLTSTVFARLLRLGGAGDWLPKSRGVPEPKLLPPVELRCRRNDPDKLRVRSSIACS